MFQKTLDNFNRIGPVYTINKLLRCFNYLGLFSDIVNPILERPTGACSRQTDKSRGIWYLV